MYPLNKLFVTFRIAYDDPRKYNDILSALDKAVRVGAPRIWDETTSFFFVETRETSAQFIERVRTSAGLRNQDLIVAVNMTAPGATAWGAFKALPLT